MLGHFPVFGNTTLGIARIISTSLPITKKICTERNYQVSFLEIVIGQSSLTVSFLISIQCGIFRNSIVNHMIYIFSVGLLKLSYQFCSRWAGISLRQQYHLLVGTF